MFKKKPAIRNSSESSHTSNLSDGISGDHQVIGKPREAVVQDAASLWDCRDRILLSVRKIKTKDQVEKEIGKDKSNTRLEEAPTIPVIEPKIIESDESYTSTEEYSSNSSIVHKSCQLQTSTKFPKHLNWILSPANKLYGQSYCSNSTCHWYPCDENIVPVHKIAFAVMVLTSLVLKTRQWLERCLQYTNHQVVTRKSETQFRLCAAVVETKYLVRELTFLEIDVNHTTGTMDQVEILIDVYDVCFSRFKKILKFVRQIAVERRK
ncbi:hypothetical protein AGLY_012447 [Aphis glycines]|uniref:Uncharacterized protein n=1 Tax=Aphis glycines TaxID=307491 RepID=A0A6G0TB13_APHGL|nr:hypothetical protein AGLY_012447 [Aphis glycines]